MGKCNVPNRTIFCHDNLPVLEGINTESIDLIYLDPPFNKKKVFTAPIGTTAEGASFTDIFREEDIKKEWIISIKEDNDEMYSFLEGIKNIGNKYNFCYLAYMAIRLIECHRVLKDTGSLYLHCDPTMSHYLKILLDCIFGESNFRSEIIWKRSNPHSDSKSFGNNTDSIFFYTKSNHHPFNVLKEKLSKEYIKKHYNHIDEKTGKSFTSAPLDALSLQGGGYRYKWNSIDKLWRVPKETMKRLHENDEIYYTKNKLARRKKFLDESSGSSLQGLWIDLHYVRGKESTGYPTQKPLKLLERIIKASSKEGDLVLDPFCGCATTCVAAEKLERKWIGIDKSHKAYDLVNERIQREVPADLFRGKADFKTVPPKRTDTGESHGLKKYVYVISHKKYKGEYKVGIAKNWQSRLNSYQTSDPSRSYKMEYKILTHQYRETEKHIHKTFDNRYEWVKADLSAIKKEIDTYQEQVV